MSKMKLILCIHNQELEHIIIPDRVHSFKNFKTKIERREAYIKYLVSLLKVKYDKVMSVMPWEIYLVVKSGR